MSAAPMTAESNLRALASRDPAFASRLSTGSGNPHVAFRSSRDGSPVPVILRADREVPLHSLVNPRAEGARARAASGASEYLVFLGLGAGYQITPYLADPETAEVLIVEKDAATLTSLFGGVDLSGILSDPRVRVVCGPGRDDPGLAALDAYLPVLSGDLRTVPLRPWCENEKEFFQEAAARLRATIERARADHSVQAHFGKRWFRNIILNLPRAESASPLPRIEGTAHLIGAGPSLDAQVSRLRAREEGSTIIATDTSLPALLGNDLVPNIVLSIDCQHYSYHHFLHGLPTTARLVLDLASPPLLARRFPRAGFFASRHPLCRYLSRYWKWFLPVDTSGGNVSHAAASLASSLGLKRIFLYGVDFSYPRGALYAKGTYLFDVFALRETRLSPQASSHFSFIFRTGSVSKEMTQEGFRYTTEVLVGFRNRFQRLIGDLDAEIVPVQGGGLPLTASVPSNRPRPAEGIKEREPAGPRRGWRAFLVEYGNRLRALAPLLPPLPSQYERLDPDARELWETVFPVAAAVQRETGAGQSRAADLESARNWMIERIDRTTGISSK